jgi:Tol biopolymer transport system component
MKNPRDYFIERIGIDDTAHLTDGEFKQFQIQENLSLPERHPEAGQILSVKVKAEIIETQIIDTPIAKSNEGQLLSGKKIMVRGKLFHKLEYVIEHDDQPVYCAEFEEFFSEDIVISNHTHCTAPVMVTPYIEDIHIRQISKRDLFVSVMLLINAVSPVQAFYEKLPDDCQGGILHRFEASKHNTHANEERYFTQIVIRQRIDVPETKPDVKQISSAIIDPEIISVKVVNTIRGRSREGQNLTGKKIVVALKINQKILYSADMACQSIHGMEEQQYTNISVAVPVQLEGTDVETLLRNKLLQPKITVEDIFATKINERIIDRSIIACLEFIHIPCYELCYTEQHSEGGGGLFVTHENGLYTQEINCVQEIPCTQKINSAHEIACDENIAFIKPKWSPDGQEIACLSKCFGKYILYIVNPKTLSKRTLLQDNMFEAISSFCWFKGGRKIVFSGVKNKNKEIFSLDMESLKQEQITQGNGLIKCFRPESSPDGKRIAYFTSMNNILDLWSSDITGSDNKPLTSCGYVKDFDWLNNDKLIYISGKGIAPDEIFIIDVNTLDRLKILTGTQDIVKKSVKVSPCGQYVALIGGTSNKKDMDDIYLYEFRNKCIINITQNISVTKISDLVWGIDSDKVYYVSDELGYCNIYSFSLKSFCKKQLTNTTASNIKINYRPRIR